MGAGASQESGVVKPDDSSQTDGVYYDSSDTDISEIVDWKIRQKSSEKKGTNMFLILQSLSQNKKILATPFAIDNSFANNFLNKQMHPFVSLKN